MNFSIRGKVIGTKDVTEIWIIHGILELQRPTSPSEFYEIGGDDHWIAPGLIDIQINGYAGIDFNSIGFSAEQGVVVAQRLSRVGVTAFYPTIITHSREHMVECLRAIARACNEKYFGDSVPGVHLEGPFLSPEDGPRGAHPIQHIRRPNWDEFCRLQEAADGKIRIVTLAPEAEGAIPLIERFTKSGIIAAIGHTAADGKAIHEAVAAGARLSTHLGNGSHASLPRLTNYVWEQLANDELWASFILDGHHLPPSVAKSMFRCKGMDKSILISDAIAAAGLGPGLYRLGEIELTVSPSHKVERADRQGSGYLAGSALDLMRGVENAVRFGGLSIELALRMASTNPSVLLGLSDRIGILKPGILANLIIFRVDTATGTIELKYTVKQGRLVCQE